MNLRHLGNQELLVATQKLAQEERALGTRFLWHIREIERRRLHLADGCSSLHSYLVKVLKYSDGSASRRLRSMALLKEMPEMESALLDGRLSMTTVSATQSFFQREAQEGRKVYTSDEKREVLKRIEDTSREGCERVFFELSPQALPKERERVVGSQETELRIVVHQELQRKLGRVRGLVAGKSGKAQISYVEMLEEMTELYLERMDPLRKLERRARREFKASVESKRGVTGVTSPEKLAGVAASPEKLAGVAASPEKLAGVAASPEKSKLGPASPEKLPNQGVHAQPSVKRHATASDRFYLYRRDGYQCAFRNSGTGRRCDARERLVPDHRRAWAKGGPTVVANMRWLCPGHNQFAAIQEFGTAKMGKYVPSIR